MKHYAIIEADNDLLHGVIACEYENQFREKLETMLDGVKDPIQDVAFMNTNFEALDDYEQHDMQLTFWDGDDELIENFYIQRIEIY